MKVKLPTGILRPLPNAEAANKILKQVFLPSEALEWLSNPTKSAKANASEVRAAERPKPVRKSGEKRKNNGGRTNGYAKRPRGSGRNKHMGDSSDISDEHFDSDSEENTDDHVDSPDMQSTLGSEDDPAENPRPGRDARTRAKAKIKQHVQKKVGRRS